MNNHIQLVLKSSTTEMSLNDHESGIYLVPEIDGLVGLPNIRTTSGVNAGYDGGWTSAQNFDARSITIRGVIANTDVAAVESMRKRLISLLAQGKSEQLTLNLVTEAGNAYELEVRTIACEMAIQTVLTQQQFMIQLRADDPLIYDGSATGESVIVQVQQAIGGFEINFEIPLAISGGEGESVIQNEGLERVYPVIKMYGALHNPTFVNLTTNQQIQIDATLGYAEGEWGTPSGVYEGKAITIGDAPDDAPLASFQLNGDTSQSGTPTPDAPVAVQTTTGENVVQICGKNLWGGTIELGGIRISDGADDGATDRVRTKEYVSVEANTEYAVSGINGIRFVIFYDSNKSFLGYELATNRATQGTFTTVQNTRYVRWYVIPIGTSPDTSIKEQLELGSTATAYEPYQGQSYEVNLGKNLFDKDNSAQILNNIYIHAHGMGTNNGFATVYIPCDEGAVYTISKVLTSRFSVGTTAVVPAVGVIVSSIVADNSATKMTYTTGAGSRYLVVQVRSASDTLTTTEIAATIQIEKGSQATSYAAYFEPIELCKIGDYQDYIYKSGGKWYVRKEVGKVILDGVSANAKFIERLTANNSKYRFRYKNSAAPASNFPSGTVAPIWCDMLTGVTMGNTWNSIQGFCYNDVGNSMIASIESLQSSTLEQANTWLASNNMTLYYVLATPTDTEITNEALIEQLEAVLGGHTYAGTNNIFTVTPNEQGTIEISYMTEKSQNRRDVIVIDSRMRTVTLNGADVYHLIAEGSEFPLLAPGENKLVLHSDITGDNGYAEVNYKQGYLSI